MKIIDILNLFENHKNITILSPSVYENKLLYHRIKLHVTNVESIDKNTIKINDSTITFVTPDTFNVDPIPISKLIVEFPNDLPYYILNKLCDSDVVYCQEIV